VTDDDAIVSLLEGMATTRAIRRFTADPIPEDALASILWHATRAPSGSNRQPFRFLVLRDSPVAEAAKEVLGQSFRSMWAEKREADGYQSGSADDRSPKARTARTMQHFVDHFEEVPVVVLPCIVRHRRPDPTEGASVYPACQNFLLAARALGYGGVMTMWHFMVEQELRELVGIPEGVGIAATIALGKPVGNHGPVRRRPVGELVFEDRWEAPASWAVDPAGTRFTGSGPPRVSQ
jgi:nitroreductase